MSMYLHIISTEERLRESVMESLKNPEVAEKVFRMLLDEQEKKRGK